MVTSFFCFIKFHIEFCISNLKDGGKYKLYIKNVLFIYTMINCFILSLPFVLYTFNNTRKTVKHLYQNFF